MTQSIVDYFPTAVVFYLTVWQADMTACDV